MIAEIRRKLADLEDIPADGNDAVTQIRSLLRETKEDLLTADVFGAMKYLPRRFYLGEVFAKIAELNPDSVAFREHLRALQESATKMVFKFWPSYATPSGLSGTRTEPDVEIADDGSLVFVEAKLHAGFGAHQIERELAVAAELARERQFFVVLVTPASQPPYLRYRTRRMNVVQYIRRVATEAEPEPIARILTQHASRVLWLSWNGLLNALEVAQRKHLQKVGIGAEEFQRSSDILLDLRELMQLRGMQPFFGFAKLIKPPPIAWRIRPRTGRLSIPRAVGGRCLPTGRFRLFKRGST